MAGLKLKAVSTEFATGSGTLRKTMVQVRSPASQKIRITGFGVSFKGTSTTQEPYRCEFVTHIVSTASLGAGTGIALSHADPSNSGITPRTTGVENITTEPYVSVLGTDHYLHQAVNVHPQTGYVYVVPNPEDIVVGPEQAFSITVVNPDNSNSGAAYIEYEE